MSGIGRPFRTDINMEQVRAMMTQNSIREIGRQLGVPCNTLFYRLRNTEIPSGNNPFCVKDRARMCVATRVGGRYFYCPQCGEDTRPKPPLVFCVSCHARMYTCRRISGETYFRCRPCRTSTFYRPPRIPKPRGGQLRRIDHQQASALLQQYPVLHVAEVLGVHRNVLYNHINKGLMTGRPFRTWTPRPGWSPASRDVAPLHWPYMKADDPRYDGLIRMVNDAVPRTLTDSVRADVCQEIMVSVLTGEITEAEISGAVRDHLKRHYRQFPVKAYGTLSLDAPIRSDGELRLIDTLSAESVAERIRDGIEANRLTESKPRKSKHFSRPKHIVKPDIQLHEYDRLRRTYQFLRSGRVVKNAFEATDTFGGSWTVETALPDEVDRLQ